MLFHDIQVKMVSELTDEAVDKQAPGIELRAGDVGMRSGLILPLLATLILVCPPRTD